MGVAAGARAGASRGPGCCMGPRRAGRAGAMSPIRPRWRADAAPSSPQPDLLRPAMALHCRGPRPHRDFDIFVTTTDLEGRISTCLTIEANGPKCPMLSRPPSDHPPCRGHDAFCPDVTRRRPDVLNRMFAFLPRAPLAMLSRRDARLVLHLAPCSAPRETALHRFGEVMARSSAATPCACAHRPSTRASFGGSTGLADFVPAVGARPLAISTQRRSATPCLVASVLPAASWPLMPPQTPAGLANTIREVRAVAQYLRQPVWNRRPRWQRLVSGSSASMDAAITLSYPEPRRHNRRRGAGPPPPRRPTGPHRRATTRPRTCAPSPRLAAYMAARRHVAS